MGIHTKGDGTLDATGVIAVTPDNMGEGLKWNPTTGKYDVTVQGGGGLDCEAITQLPVASWEKGTSILANKNGKCVRLVPQEDFFQEVGVGIATSKTSGFTSEEFRVVVTVSNTGVGKNELTDWVITKPAAGAYTIKNIEVSSNNVDRVEEVSEFTYKLHGIASGGTAIVSFVVVPTATGTFQFSSTVAPNSALDQNRSNNTATATLSVSQKADPDYVPSVDCPLLTVTELDFNTVLPQLTAKKGALEIYLPSNNPQQNRSVFAQRTSLKGLRLKLSHPGTVVGYSNGDRGTAYWGYYYLSNGNVFGLAGGNLDHTNSLLVNHDALKQSTFSGFKVEGDILTITEDTTSFIFSIRPNGSNCRWQNYALSSAIQTNINHVTVSNVVGGTVEKTVVYEKMRKRSDNTGGLAMQFIIPSSVEENAEYYTNEAILGSTTARANALEKIIFRVRRGTKGSLSFSFDKAVGSIQTRGKVEITSSGIVVSADALPSDSVNSEFIQVIVE